MFLVHGFHPFMRLHARRGRRTRPGHTRPLASCRVQNANRARNCAPVRRVRAPSYLARGSGALRWRMTPITSISRLQWQASDESARAAEARLAHAWSEFAAGKFLPPSRDLVQSAIRLRRESDVKFARLHVA